MKTLLIIALLLTTTPLALAWEEQLEACRIRGIPPSDCPDDESYVGIPYNPSSGGDGGSSSSTSRTHRVWVLDTYWKTSAETVCYTAHYRLIREHNGWRENIDFPERTTKSCINVNTIVPNLVLP